MQTPTRILTRAIVPRQFLQDEQALDIREAIKKHPIVKKKPTKSVNKSLAKKQKNTGEEPTKKRIKRKGFIYAFVTPSMPNCVKIGLTTRSVEVRLCEANKRDTYRPPLPYRVLCAIPVKNAKKSEHKIHKMLRCIRISAKREFFKISQKACRVLFQTLEEKLLY